MGQKVTLGGQRLGSGQGQEVWMDGYHSSNHDLSFVWRGTMTTGPLVPFLKIPVVMGDNFDINVKSLIKTAPTALPVFGSFKYQIDFFMCPNRLYIGPLHNNATGVGRKMGQVMIPQMRYTVPPKKFYTLESKPENEPNLTQVAPDSLTYCLGISGLGENITNENQTREFNALPFLAVADIFKNFYSNKQEKNAYVLTNSLNSNTKEESFRWYLSNGNPIPQIPYVYRSISNPRSVKLITKNLQTDINLNNAEFTYKLSLGETVYTIKSKMEQEVLTDMEDRTSNPYVIGTKITSLNSGQDVGLQIWLDNPASGTVDVTIEDANVTIFAKVNAGSELKIKPFPLENIDEAREIILAKRIGQKLTIGTSSSDDINFSPYVDNVTTFTDIETKETKTSCSQTMNGLLLRTYMSDIFQNWLRTEWIDEINAASAIQIKDGAFTMDALIIAKRVWNYQNRIAVSGGTYQDWQEATWGRDAQKFCESPIFMGGASGIISFDEVVSTASTEGQPIGTLAGKGGLSNSKGGSINIKVQEAGYIIGIVSIVPYIDYYQGTDWDMTELKTMDDYHKPEFDNIGFQDLQTEWMAAWTTKIGANGALTKTAIGKQPAWTHYMTKVNKVHGDFCKQTSGMDSMVITRRYEPDWNSDGVQIKDLTTYVFPQHYNYIFATSELELQPFWVQIGCDIFARRVMSAAAMPTL